MKYTLNLCIAVLMSLGVFGQSEIDTTKVPFVAYWSKGDVYNFKVSKIKQSWKAGELVKDEKKDYVSKFEVIDSTETSYTINWSYENDLTSSYEIPNELMDKFSKYKFTHVTYKTSEFGDFIEIINWKEIGELMNKMFDDIIEVKGINDKKKKNTLIEFIKPFKDMYSSKQGIEQIIFKELHYFHFPMGVEFDVNEPLVYDDELPNMFGGKPIKAKGEISFEHVDFDENFCKFKQELKLDPTDTMSMLEQVFKKMKMNKKTMKKALKDAVFKINDYNTFEYHYYPGVPHKIETNREVIVDIQNEKSKNIDKTVIELIYDED